MHVHINKQMVQLLTALACEMCAASRSLPRSDELDALDQIAMGAILCMVDSLHMAPLTGKPGQDNTSPVPMLIQAGCGCLFVFLGSVCFCVSSRFSSVFFCHAQLASSSRAFLLWCW